MIPTTECIILTQRSCCLRVRFGGPWKVEKRLWFLGHLTPHSGVARKAFGKNPSSETIGVNDETGSRFGRKCQQEITHVEQQLWLPIGRPAITHSLGAREVGLTKT